MPIELYIFNAAAISIFVPTPSVQLIRIGFLYLLGIVDAAAISIFVPTPSVQLIRIGFLYLLGIVDAAANPPIDPIISFL